MDDLAQWYGEQLDQDERVARRATVRQPGGGEWVYDGENVQAASGLGVGSRIVPVHGEHVAEHDPARVLRDIDANRQVLAMARARIEEAASSDYLVNGPARMALVVMEPVLRSLASAYADRPGYREEWRP